MAITMPRSALLISTVGLVASLACATGGESLSGEPEAPSGETPESKQADAWGARTLTELEQRLQSATEVEIAFVIESDGAVVSHLEGELRWVRDGAVSLTASGEFAGVAQALELRGDADSLETLLGGASHWTGERPPALVEALVIGLTRQGLLHNLAVLTGGLPPDHANGGAAEWVEVVTPQLGEPELLGTVQARPLEFQITVEDQLVGHATLWLDGRGIPLERQQVVNFPDGQMRVTERYTAFTIRD